MLPHEDGLEPHHCYYQKDADNYCTSGIITVMSLRHHKSSRVDPMELYRTRELFAFSPRTTTTYNTQCSAFSVYRCCTIVPVMPYTVEVEQ